MGLLRVFRVFRRKRVNCTRKHASRMPRRVSHDRCESRQLQGGGGGGVVRPIARITVRRDYPATNPLGGYRSHVDFALYPPLEAEVRLRGSRHVCREKPESCGKIYVRIVRNAGDIEWSRWRIMSHQHPRTLIRFTAICVVGNNDNNNRRAAGRG